MIRRWYLFILLLLYPLASTAQTSATTPPPEVLMRISGRGDVILKLDPKAAPLTCDHFLSLCHQKFYDGILFHRVVEGVLVQAGDPQTKTKGVNAPGIGTGGSGHPIPFEKNDLVNDTGTIAMALSSPRSNTGDSQWFINLKPNHEFDGDYCVFGYVVKGMSPLRNVKVGDKIISIREIHIKPGTSSANGKGASH